MNQAQFEKLSRNLMNVIRRVRDEESLLNVSCRLLGAEVAILICRESTDEGTKRILHHVYPHEYQEAVKDNLDDLREWYNFVVSTPGFEGFTKEGSLKIADKEFPDALVAFGDRLLDNKYPCHEMILLKRPGDKEPYRSYHCWAAAQLIRQFEFFDLQDNLQKETKRRLGAEKSKEQYAASLSIDVLPYLRWKDVKEKLEQITEPDIRWLYYVMWTGYQVRKKHKKGYKPADSIDSVLEDQKIGKPPSDIFYNVVHFLLDSKDLESKAPSKDGNENSNESPGGSLLSELKKKLRFVEIPPWEKKENQLWSQLIMLVIEHAWRNLWQETSVKAIDDPHVAEGKANSQSQNTKEPNMSETVKLAKNLLCLTRGFVIQVLASKGSRNRKNDGDGSVAPDLQELGRGFLRFYLAQEIVKPNSRLEKLYLSDEHEKNEYPKAPSALKRAFILNLSRFMLSIVALIEKQLDISNQPPIVTTTEELDSLLYIIDRFVHVELEVDERINIQEHLGRQIHSEVRHYLTRPSYRYRDHLLHVVDVFLLGHLLLNTISCWINSNTIPMIKHFTKLAVSKKPNGQQPILKMEWMQNWAVGSLLHDIGYQIGDGDSISSDPHIWKNYFALTSPVSESWLEFNWKGQKDQDSQSQQERLDFAKNLADQLCKDSPQDSPLKGYLPKIDDNNIKDHGVLSALRIAQITFHADYKIHSDMAFKYRHAIHAIAYHNLANHKVVFDSHPLACLLRLCDELQEWNRRRVNMEKIVKQLYLDFQEGHLESFQSYEMVDSFKANLKLEPVYNDKIPISMKVSSSDSKPWFRFDLAYRDSIESQFDPTMTLLRKAYNLQHLDLNVADQGANDLKFSINLLFPSPKEYGELTEYDIYALFTEKVRSLPLLRHFESIQKAEPGLTHLEPESEIKTTSQCDCFGILLTRESSPGYHHGWLPLDPAHFFDQYIEFKKYILASSRARIPQK